MRLAAGSVQRSTLRDRHSSTFDVHPNASCQKERSRPFCPGFRCAYRRGGVRRPARLPTLSWGVDSDTGCPAVSAVRWMVHRTSRASIEITMDKQFSHLLQLGRRGAERRFDELVNELSFLFASFPHLASRSTQTNCPCRSSSSETHAMPGPRRRVDTGPVRRLRRPESRAD